MSSSSNKETKEDKPKKAAKAKGLPIKIPPIYFKIAATVIALILAIMGLLQLCSAPPAREKTYVIGRDSSWYPLQLFNKSKNMTAFTDKLMAEIAAEENIRVRIVDAGSTRLFTDLDSRVYDGVISVLSPNSAFHERYLFSDPFYFTGPVLIVSKDSKITSIKEMEGRTVGLRSGTGGAYINLPENKFPLIITATYDSMAAAIADLENDKIDGIITDALEAYGYTQGLYAGKLKVVTAPLNDEGLRIILLNEPHNEIFIEKFHKGFKKLFDNGRYAQLLQDWGLINTEVFLSVPPRERSSAKKQGNE